MPDSDVMERRNGRPLDLARLADKFPARDIEWRLQSCGTNREGKVWGKCLAYVTNRAIMARLDEVVGPANWRNEFREWQGSSTLCGISVLVNGQWVTKWDGAENTDIESVKGGLSSAMKRAAVQWGIGRYLYDLDEGWAQIVEKGEHYGKTKEGKSFQWNPPPLPAWALPRGNPPPPDDSIEANSLPRGERADLRQSNPRPTETPRSTEDQQAAIRTLIEELKLTAPQATAILKPYEGCKRFSWLTPNQAKEVILGLLRRRTAQLLTLTAYGMGELQESVDVKADTVDELTLDEADAAIGFLRTKLAQQEA